MSVPESKVRKNKLFMSNSAYMVFFLIPYRMPLVGLVFARRPKNRKFAMKALFWKSKR
jgi:hypothetical protein